MKFSFWSRATLLIALGLFVAGTLVMPSPALAQFTKSWKFLQAVREKNGEEVMDDLGDSSSNIINTHDSVNGQTALHIVTARRDYEWMQFLISRGADVNARDLHGQTALVLASDMGFVEGVQLLVKYGAHVDEPSSTGETPLIAAVHRRDLAMMRVLLTAGASPDRADNSGRSARDYAQLGGKNNSLSALIDQLARPEGDHPSGSYGPTL